MTTTMTVLPLLLSFFSAHAFQVSQMATNNNYNRLQQQPRRSVLMGAGGGFLGGFFGGGERGPPNGDGGMIGRANAGDKPFKRSGPTNEIIKVVNGMKRRRLGGSDIIVSELGLGTQRW